MELYQLRSFVAIVEAGQLTRASAKLHISQPALSAQLRALEEELDLTLFERKPAGMVLTPVGKKILKLANRVLTAARALQSEARLIKGKVTGAASIGTLSDPEFIRLGEFMSEAVTRFARVACLYVLDDGLLDGRHRSARRLQRPRSRQAWYSR